MDKHLPATAMKKLADYEFQRYFAIVPPGTAFEDLFTPTFWAHHVKKLRTHDIIRVRAEDGSFDFSVTVIATPQGGVNVEPWPKYPNSASAVEAAKIAADAKPKALPVRADGKPKARVEYLPATKWRAIGVDGSEIGRDYPSKAAAEAALAKYLKTLGYENEEAA